MGFHTRARIKGLGALKQATNAKMVRVLQEVGFDIAENITVGGRYSPGTPVDTSFARHNWHLELNGTVTGVGPSNVNDMSVAIAGLTALVPIRFVNNTEYIGPLEFGHSQQAPNGFVRLTLGAIQMIVDAAVRRVNAETVRSTYAQFDDGG